MSSLAFTTYDAWNSEPNIAFAAYRAFENQQEPPKRLELFKGCVSNAFKAIGYSFAALPAHLFKLGDKQISVWTQAKIFWELTWICIKAMVDFDPTMASLREFEAQVCVNTILRTDVKEDALEPVKARLSVLIPKLRPEQQKTIFKNLEESCAKVPQRVKSLTWMPFLLSMVDNENVPSSLVKPIVECLAKQLAAQNQVFIYSSEEGVLISDNYLMGTYPFQPHPEFPNQGELRILSEGYDLEFFGKWDTLHAKDFNCDDNELWSDTLFLWQLFHCRDDKVNAFLTVAFAKWAERLVSKDTFDDALLTQLDDLTNLYQSQNLKTAIQLYDFWVHDSTLLARVDAQIINPNMDRIVAGLFAETTKLDVAPIVVNLIAYHLHLKQYDRIIALCQVIKANPGRLQDVPESIMKPVLEEFSEIWNKFPAKEHLDVCLALYQAIPRNSDAVVLIPEIDHIPQIAYAAASEITPVPPQCEPILVRYLEYGKGKGTDSQRWIAISTFLELAQTKQMAQLRDACISACFDEELYTHPKLSITNLRLIVDSLKGFKGPDAKMNEHAILEEALVLQNLAEKYQASEPAISAKIMAYLKATAIYATTLRKFLENKRPSDGPLMYEREQKLYNLLK